MKQPYVCIFSLLPFSDDLRKKIEATTTPYFYIMPSPSEILTAIHEKQPDVIVSVGTDFSQFTPLCELTLKQRQSWLHFNTANDVHAKINQLYYCFINHAIKYHNDSEMVTIFSTSFNSKQFILRPFNTLRQQTYTNWEWIIFDDSPNLDGKNENFNILKSLKDQDPRIRIYRADGNSGIIGNVKSLASGLARGSYLIELDHDDELTTDAVAKTYAAFQEFPDAGFVYSDFSEIFEDGANFAYSENFGVGYGAYRKEFRQDGNSWRNVCCSPPINAVTARYHVALPNHLRAWRRSLFNQIGGWNPRFHVADDFEIMIRSFLESKYVRIPRLCYYQYRNQGGNNFTFIRNQEIQKLSHVLFQYYNNKIHDRLIKLGSKDPYLHTWTDWSQFGKSWLNPSYEAKVNYTADIDTNMVSIVITCDKDTSAQTLFDLINTALEQNYSSKEVFCIGVMCPELENTANKFKTHKNIKQFKWWNLEEGDQIDATNYACKMLVLTNYVCYWKLSDNDTNYVTELMQELTSNPALNWSYDHSLHKTSVFQITEYYHKKHIGLYEQYNVITNNPYQEKTQEVYKNAFYQ
jgi:GT2 family glycosyltransferase